MTLPLTGLPEYVAGQLQPELPINTALRGLEQGATRFVVIDDTLTAPPGGEADGDAYVPASPATGAWVGKEDHIALFMGTAYVFVPPRAGMYYQVAGGNAYEYVAGSPPGWIIRPLFTAPGTVAAIPVACGDETTDLAVADGLVTFRMPYALTLTAVRASLTTAAAGADVEVDIVRNGTTILSAPLTIDAGDKTSVGSTSPVGLSASALADDDEIRIDLDQVGSSTAGAGLKVYLIGLIA